MEEGGGRWNGQRQAIKQGDLTHVLWCRHWPVQATYKVYESRFDLDSTRVENWHNYHQKPTQNIMAASRALASLSSLSSVRNASTRLRPRAIPVRQVRFVNTDKRELGGVGGSEPPGPQRNPVNWYDPRRNLIPVEELTASITGRQDQLRQLGSFSRACG